jgi:hypothetical protein
MHSLAKRLARMLMDNGEQYIMIKVSAYQSHAPVQLLYGKHHRQGVWGAARHPSGEREGQSPLAAMTRA